MEGEKGAEARQLPVGANPLAGRFMTSQSRRSPRPPSETVPVPMPPRGKATRARWSWSYSVNTGHTVCTGTSIGILSESGM